jgi:hypothetical protein
MKQEPLFDLINSLTMSEKRFFKIFSKRHIIGEKNEYSLLFDFIDKETGLTNKKLLSQPFVKNVSAEKNYLYRLILKSLNSFNSQNSDIRKIYDNLISIDILFKKGLYTQALELVNKALKLAKKKELLRQALLLTEIKEELLLKDQEHLQTLAIFKEDEQLILLIKNLLSMRELTTRGYHKNLSKGLIRNDEDLLPFAEIVEHEIVKDQSKALTARARLHQISVQLTYNMVAGDNKQVLEFVNQIITHYDAHPHLIDYTPIGYVSSNFIKGSALLASNKTKEVKLLIKKYTKIEEIDSVLKSQKALSSLFFYKNILLLQVDQTADLEEVEKGIPKHEPFIGKPQLYDLYFQMSLCFFAQKDFKKSLKWSNQILNDLQFKSREDFLNTIKLMNLLIHFELGNDFTLEYLSKSTNNFLKRKSRLFKVEKLLIKFFTRYESYAANGNSKAELEKLAERLTRCKEDKHESKAFHYFDYLKWVKQKI